MRAVTNGISDSITMAAAQASGTAAMPQATDVWIPVS